MYGWDQPKQTEGNVAILNLQLLAARPEQLAQGRESGELKSEANEECRACGNLTVVVLLLRCRYCPRCARALRSGASET